MKNMIELDIEFEVNVIYSYYSYVVRTNHKVVWSYLSLSAFTGLLSGFRYIVNYRKVFDLMFSSKLI